MGVRIEVSIAKQILTLTKASGESVSWPVSTAKNGVGERQGSGCTPRGSHQIRIKIGEGLVANTVFIGRRPTGEIYDANLGDQFPERDWILTRILWLSGTDVGFNRGGQRDTQRRYIYIHGTPDSEPMGRPLSHGCIRMRNQDLIELFDQVDAGTPVQISET